MIYAINFLYGCFEGFWRRWFGGLFEHSSKSKILSNRFLQHVVGFLACFGILFLNGYTWLVSLISALIFQGLFWARSHGCCFDFGHGKVDEKRYNQLWYWKYVKKIIPKEDWYTFTGDYILMTVRYSLPAFLMGLIMLNASVAMMGIVLSGVYALMWKLYDWKYLTSPTATAEIISGVLIGWMLIS